MSRITMMHSFGGMEPITSIAGLRGFRGVNVRNGVHCLSPLGSATFSRIDMVKARNMVWLAIIGNSYSRFCSNGFHAAKNSRFSVGKSMARSESGSSWTRSVPKEAELTDQSVSKVRTQSSWGSTATSRSRDISDWPGATKADNGRLRERYDNGETNNSGSIQRRRGDRSDQGFQRMMKKRELFGGRTGKGASESSVPKVIGEAVYGLGPVLAALSIERRQFNVLYVQEGVELSSKNRKKKDKKGFEKVLQMAENASLSIKEISKHDLNMMVDNRPHQGLVLDCSPLEMVRISELDPVLSDEDRRSLWVALDEVTDPQNLGAIIRSSYFFGASGVVLCAKNSAPLSGVVSKASAGSLELMELRYCKNMMQFLIASAENGWRVLGGSVASKAVPLNEILPGEPTILVLGSEGSGLRTLVERSCTQLVRIPGLIPIETEAMELSEELNPKSFTGEVGSFLAVESLNVSVAAGVFLHHLAGNSLIQTPRSTDPCNFVVQ